MIAILSDLDDDLARQVAALRQPGGTGLAMVLDPHRFGTSRHLGLGGGSVAHDTHESGASLSSVSVLRSAGWSVVPVGAEDSVSSVWAALAGAMSPVGAP